jgi:predicted phosphodiesterase
MMQADPMRLGLLSDVHGNLVALDAVIADGRAQEVEAWWVLGDLVAIGPDPASTLARLMDLPGVRVVRGNTDRYTVTGARPFPRAEDVARDASLEPLRAEVDASFAWTRAQLDPGALDLLAGLPTTQRATLPDGTRLLGVHASPDDDDGPGITPHLPERELAALLAGGDADVVCGGHTHQPTDRRVGSTRAVNLGSVSNPTTTDRRATYVVVDADRHGHRLAHRRVAYDHDAVVGRVRRSGHPSADFVAGFQRGEQARYPADRPGSPRYES